ncbi:periplasmic binding protein-like II [Neocallimastix lanati (nom. inval.)]|uniref:Periplasmic binding protein-like II n=1 Tax=Neocallimastix californiae TaxID=1754190 RepID=A0A1Y2ADP4_9FUNG|nr:periplasmic binding protein-like II [Neocallimastix sp. JGI-2020a]ORY20584.1 periplasmic binding protein-like II [Neocallimastix californiae]|eukprot:ORY20584.1 periplasmic binding protein-like II [Neocallimastix californiae]
MWMELKFITDRLHIRYEESESDENYIMSNGEMIIGIENNKPPMTYCDNIGDLTGFDIEFAEAVCSKLGIDIVFKEIKWSMKESELESKSIDCVWSALTVTEPRRNIFEFTRSYIYNKQAVVIRRSDASKFTDTKSLSRAQIAVKNSSTSEEALLGDPYLSQSNYTTTSSQTESLNFLKNGLCDAIIIDYTFAKFYVPNDKSDLKIIEDINLQEEQYAVGFRHGSDMVHKLDNLFLNMILDGSLTALSEKYNLYDLYAPIILTDYDYIMNKGIIIIGFLENLPPMNYYDKNGQLIGFDVDFAKEIFKDLGIDIKFKSISWDEKEIELNNRRIDCIWSALTVTDERREIIKFSRVYMSDSQAIIIRKSDTSKYADIESFSNVKISAVTGSLAENLIKNNPYLSNSKLIISSSNKEAIIMLENEEIDAVIIDYTVAVNLIAKSSKDLMVVEGIDFDNEEYAVGFRYGSDMTVKVNELINNMINDGRLESLAKKYNLINLYNTAINIDGKSDMNYIMSKGELIVGIEDNSPPMSYYDNSGRLMGFDIELLTEICSRLGIYVIFKNIDWNKKEEELNDKNIDCFLNSQSITEESFNNIDFSIGYLINKQVVVIRKSDESKFSNAESLSGVKMSAGHSTVGEELFKYDAHLKKAKYTASSSQNEAIAALENKTVDAIVIDYATAKVNIENDKPNLMIVEGIILQEKQYRIGFRAGSDMTKKVSNIILDMNIDGKLSTFATKYDLVDSFIALKTTDAKYIMENGKMIIGYYGEYPPMSYYDNNDQLTGFDTEFAKAICKRLGIEAEFKLIDWNEKDSELKNRNIDCIWNGLNVMENQRSVIKYSRIYMKYKPVVVIRKSDILIYTNFESLSTEKITAEFNTPEEKALKKDKYLSKAKYTSSYSEYTAINALRNHIFDAIVIDPISAIGLIGNDYSDMMILSELTDAEEESYAVGFRIGSDMTVKVNKLINDMINDGTLELIAKKYDLLKYYESTIIKNDISDYEYIISKGEMIIGVDIDGPPISYYDEYGELTGFDTEFAKAVCSKLGIDAVFKKIDWDKKEEELNNKNIDCIWDALTVTEERHNYFKFSNPYLSNRQAVVIRSSDASKFTDTKSLSEAKLTAIFGTISEEVIEEDQYLSKANYNSSFTQEEAVIGLKNKSFDAIVIDYTIAKGIINNNNDLMIINDIHLSEEQYAVGFRLNSDIPEKVNNMILDMILDDTLNNLAKKYGLVDLFTPVKITDASYIMNNGKIIIGFDGSMAPMTYYDKNDQLTGFDIDLAKAVCHRLGITAEFKEVDWTEKENELKNRNIDCIWSCFSITEKRRETVKFSRVYMNNKQIIVIRKSNIIKFYTVESLSNARISSKIGTLGETAIKTYLPNATFQGFPDLEDALIELEKGNIDAVVTDYTMAKDKINNGGFSDLMIIEGIELMNDQYAIGFRYGSDMSKKVNEIIKNMTLDGTINEIAEKYDLLDLYSHNKGSSKKNILEVSLFMALFFVLIIAL